MLPGPSPFAFRRRTIWDRVRTLIGMTALPVAVAFAVVGVAAGGWRDEAPLPTARGEVAAAAMGEGIAVVGGFLADGRSSRRVEVYAPATRRWHRLPDLPRAVNHTFA